MTSAPTNYWGGVEVFAVRNCGGQIVSRRLCEKIARNRGLHSGSRYSASPSKAMYQLATLRYGFLGKRKSSVTHIKSTHDASQKRRGSFPKQATYSTMHKTLTPCPELRGRYWSGCVHIYHAYSHYRAKVASLAGAAFSMGNMASGASAEIADPGRVR